MNDEAGTMNDELCKWSLHFPFLPYIGAGSDKFTNINLLPT